MFGSPKDRRTEMKPPAGAILYRQEIRDLVIEARKGKKAIRVYTVTQGGRLDCFYIYSRSRLHKPEDAGLSFTSENDPGQWFVDVIDDHACIGRKKTNDRWFKTKEVLGSYNIESFGGNCHYAFTSKLAAQAYSNELKNDATYQQYVKDWHAHCDKLFARMW